VNWSKTLNRLTLYAFAGALVGLLVGLLLVALTDRVTNPFWAVAVGIFVAAVLTPLTERSRAGS
jgi:uncharacterized protein YacL